MLALDEQRPMIQRLQKDAVYGRNIQNKHHKQNWLLYFKGGD